MKESKRNMYTCINSKNDYRVSFEANVIHTKGKSIVFKDDKENIEAIIPSDWIVVTGDLV